MKDKIPEIVFGFFTGVACVAIVLVPISLVMGKLMMCFDFALCTIVASYVAYEGWCAVRAKRIFDVSPRVAELATNVYLLRRKENGE